MNVQKLAQNVTPHVYKGENKVVQTLLEVIPDSKVGKNLTRLDINMFKAYMSAKPYMMGVSPKEIAELEKFEGIDYVLQVYDFLTNKLGFNEKIRPMLIFGEMSPSLHANYFPVTNIITINKKTVGETSKPKLFSYLRHELQHFIQNQNILRHEEFGEKAIDLMVDKYFNYERKVTEHILRNSSMQDVYKICHQQQKQDPQKLYKDLMEAKMYLDTNDSKGFDSVIGRFTQQYREEIIQYRKNIIEELGLIKKDSALTPKIEEYYKEFEKVDYYNPNGTIDPVKYLHSKVEQEALDAQRASEKEALGEPCFIRYLKKSFFEEIKDPEVLKIMEKVSAAKNT